LPAKPIMIQGTGSHVGKSVVAAALCRIFAQDGYRVAPYKSQNMALNSYVTKEGGEMSRAQVVQAQAARVEPHVDMNPILLKPTGNMQSQVVVLGKSRGTMPWGEYRRLRAELLAVSLAAYRRLAAAYDVIVIEGAGSPAEVNLKEGDIVNMRIAQLTGAPVLLVTDIDRGGALAWVIGTLALLPPEERALVRGIIINKFRGDVRYLQPGLDYLQERTGVPVVGVLPYLPPPGLPAEDSVSLEEDAAPSGAQAGCLHIAVIRLPTISNFTDFDDLAAEPDVRLRFVSPGTPLEPADCVIIPGSKNTLDDLKALWSSGTAEEIVAFHRRGGLVVGLGGGYQMLGWELTDPDAAESDLRRMAGLGLLPVSTCLDAAKQAYQVGGRVTASFAAAVGLEPAAEYSFQGYEIHCGVTELAGGQPWLRFTRLGEDGCREDGCFAPATSEAGAVAGTYVHGIFDAAEFRRTFLNLLRRQKGWQPLQVAGQPADDPYDRLAEAVRKHLDMAVVREIMGL
jgi:adenosylcobyric acid synthase